MIRYIYVSIYDDFELNCRFLFCRYNLGCNRIYHNDLFRFQKSFRRKICYDWTRYTHMYLRLRGDGRNYQLNIKPEMYFDHMWDDIFNVPVHTRGGPYWQICKVRR